MKKKENGKQEINRRNFFINSAMGAIGALTSASFLNSCSDGSTIKFPLLPEKARDGKTLRAGLIGCGARGTGAAINFVNSGSGLEIIALGDVFQDRIDRCKEHLKKHNVNVPDENCFAGFDNYEKVIDSGVDVVLLCAPPHFRPVHLEAAINARKHVFMEKPCAVDPVGVRSVMASAKKAEALELSIVSGTVKRWWKNVLETYCRVANGEIGEITGASIIRNQNSLWYRNKVPEWTNMEYLIRNWRNYCWLSGDDILEVFVHELDLMNWFTGKLPVKAIGYGGRQQRLMGDLYDFFSIEYIYDNGMHTHCGTRYINGCDNLTEQLIAGTKGSANCMGQIVNVKGETIWEYSSSEAESKKYDPYVQEHVTLVEAIRSGKPFNDAEELANSTLVGIMGRVSAYTGKDVTWDEIMNSDLYLGPKTYDFNMQIDIPDKPPVIGTGPTRSKTLNYDY